VWRFTGERVLSETAEGRAQKVVSVTYFLLLAVAALRSMAPILSTHVPQR